METKKENTFRGVFLTIMFISMIGVALIVWYLNKFDSAEAHEQEQEIDCVTYTYGGHDYKMFSRGNVVIDVVHDPDCECQYIDYE